MATTLIPGGLVPVADTVFADAERLALVGFLAGCRCLTRQAYTPGPAPVHRVVH